MYRVYIDKELMYEMNLAQLIEFVLKTKTKIQTDHIVDDVDRLGRRMYDNVVIRKLVKL